MKNIALTLCCLLTSLQAVTQPHGDTKLSPWVRDAVAKYTTTVQHSRRSVQSPSPTMTVFVETEPGTDTDWLFRQYGGKEYARQRNVSIITVPLHQIAPLSAIPAVKRIEARQLPSLTMDTVPGIVGVLPVYEHTGQHPAFTGKDVIVGLVDVGFDLSHPGFRQSDNPALCRIKAFWDQLSPDTIGSAFPVGRDYTSGDAIVALGCSTDGRTEYHGTHTAGIAAGTGYDTPYRGVAYDSDICLVANAVSSDTIYISPDDYYKYTTATDALGFKYIFDYADSQGKPCVASFSEGYIAQFDEEDRLFSDFLDGLSGPGRIIAVAAGNENAKNTRAVKSADERQAGAFLTGYYESVSYRILANGPLTIGVRPYSAATQAPLTPLIVPGADSRWAEEATDTLWTENGHWWAVTFSRSQSAFTSQDIYVLQLSADVPIGTAEQIAISMEGEGTAATLFGGGSSMLANRPEIDPQWQAATNGGNILSPAWFPSVITVGASIHRPGFTNYKGEYKQIYYFDALGRISVYSSQGPTIDGRIKPDVTAPGININSAYNSYFHEANPDDDSFVVSNSSFEGRIYPWANLSGTSMSCPIVAGVIALWLQACPTLTREDILNLFSLSCKKYDATLSYPNNAYGYGEIDAYAGLLRLLGLDGIKTLSSHQPDGVVVTNSGSLLHLAFSPGGSADVHLKVYSLAGKLVKQCRITPSDHVTVTLPALPSGLYAIQLNSSDRAFNGSQIIRLTSP